MQWVPQVPSEDFRQAMDVPDDTYCFISDDGQVHVLKKGSFEPLSRSVLLPFTVSRLVEEVITEDGADSEIVHLPQSRFVLWRGMKLGEKSPQSSLPAPKEPTNSDEIL